MSKVIIDLNEFVHLKGESVYNHNYYKHKEFGYTILIECCEESQTLHFYKVESGGRVFLFSCQCFTGYEEEDVYKGDLGFFWS